MIPKLEDRPQDYEFRTNLELYRSLLGYPRLYSETQVFKKKYYRTFPVGKKM